MNFLIFFIENNEIEPFLRTVCGYQTILGLWLRLTLRRLVRLLLLPSLPPLKPPLPPQPRSRASISEPYRRIFAEEILRPCHPMRLAHRACVALSSLSSRQKRRAPNTPERVQSTPYLKCVLATKPKLLVTRLREMEIQTTSRRPTTKTKKSQTRKGLGSAQDAKRRKGPGSPKDAKRPELHVAK